MVIKQMTSASLMPPRARDHVIALKTVDELIVLSTRPLLLCAYSPKLRTTEVGLLFKVSAATTLLVMTMSPERSSSAYAMTSTVVVEGVRKMELLSGIYSAMVRAIRLLSLKSSTCRAS